MKKKSITQVQAEIIKRALLHAIHQAIVDLANMPEENKFIVQADIDQFNDVLFELFDGK